MDARNCASKRSEMGSIADFEEDTIIGEGEIERMGRPRGTGMLTRGSVHRMKCVRLDGARLGRMRRIGIGIEKNLSETALRAGNHLARIARGEILDWHLKARGRVVQNHKQLVDRIEDEHIV